MTNQNERWGAVGEALTDRIAQLRMTKAEVLRASGLTNKTLDSYLQGAPIKRIDKARDLCRAIGWSLDSIERILDGGEPVLVDQPFDTEAAIRADPYITEAAKRALLAAYAAARG